MDSSLEEATLPEPTLGTEAIALISCFPPRGYGSRSESHLKYQLALIKYELATALAELKASRLIRAVYVPRNCGPGRHRYYLTVKGRTTRQAMSAALHPKSDGEVPR